MRILVNATTCVVGGGIQVASSFIQRSLHDPGEHNFFYAVSPAIESCLARRMGIGDKLVVLEPSPARLRARRSSSRRLRESEALFRPDVVFTVFGPSYVRFSSPHLCGFADGWVTHPSSQAKRLLSTLGRLRLALKARYKSRHLSRRDYYWVESKVSQLGLERILGIPMERIRVIPNCYAPIFDSVGYGDGNRESQTTHILTLSAPYLHKNLSIIPRAAAILRQRDPKWNYRFIVTLPKQGPKVADFWDLARRLEVAEMIQNVGPVPLDRCPDLYAACDIMFLPTLLETFSVSYLEAMRAGRAIVTTDLDFARDVCGEAAEYFQPISAKAAAAALSRVARDTQRRRDLVDFGRQRLQTFPTPEEKYQSHLRWLCEVATQKAEAA